MYLASSHIGRSASKVSILIMLQVALASSIGRLEEELEGLKNAQDQQQHVFLARIRNALNMK